MFDFNHLNDSQLMELIDDIPGFPQIGSDAHTWADLQAEWLVAARAELARRQTRRILVRIVCTQRGHNYADDQVFTGTTAQFRAAFGMPMSARVFMPTGTMAGYDADGRPVVMTWEPMVD